MSHPTYFDALLNKPACGSVRLSGKMIGYTDRRVLESPADTVLAEAEKATSRQ